MQRPARRALPLDSAADERQHVLVVELAGDSAEVVQLPGYLDHEEDVGAQRAKAHLRLRAHEAAAENAAVRVQLLHLVVRPVSVLAPSAESPHAGHEGRRPCSYVVECLSHGDASLAEELRVGLEEAVVEDGRLLLGVQVEEILLVDPDVS